MALTQEQLRELQRNATGIQTMTWVTHALGTILAPFIIALFLPGPKNFWAALLATGLAVYFGLHREPMDKLKHQLRGDYDEPDAQGITPRVDRVGDTLGPLVVAAAYWMATLLHIVS